MSLNRAEQAITSHELQANLGGSGLTKDEVATDLGWNPDRLDSTIAFDAFSLPEDVWELRDYLEQTLEDLARPVTPFTVLTEQARRRATDWFLLRRPARHTFAS